MSAPTIVIDGAYGEGGGQVLRSSLALSLVTGKPFQVINLRAKRKNPGLAPQHLTTVRAAARIAEAHVEGDSLGSQRLTFYPGSLRPGQYTFDVSEVAASAGAVTLILQSLLIPLSLAPSPSRITLKGGTHVPMSPPLDYLDQVFFPLLSQMGPTFQGHPLRFGFYPRGGGEYSLTITPTPRLSPIRWLERGALLRLLGVVALSQLPEHIPQRILKRAEEKLQPLTVEFTGQVVEKPSRGPGVCFTLVAEYEQTRAGFSSLGERGKPAEHLAEEACQAFFQFHQGEGSLDPFMGDQMVVPVALAQGPSTYSVAQVTSHLETNLWVTQQFLPEAELRLEGTHGQPGVISSKGISSLPLKTNTQEEPQRR